MVARVTRSMYKLRDPADQLEHDVHIDELYRYNMGLTMTLCANVLSIRTTEMEPSSASQSQSTGCDLVSDCQQTSGGKKMAMTNDQKRMIRRHQVANGERSWIRNPSGFSGRNQQNRKCRYLRGRRGVKKAECSAYSICH